MQRVALFATAEEDPSHWLAELRRQDPELELRVWPAIGHTEEIEYAIVARPPAGALAQCPNLKAIFSMWAGVEDLIADPAVQHLPIYRMVEPGLTNGIVLYVVHHVTGLHNQAAYYNSKQWYHPFQKRFIPPQATTVGILGLGNLGAACARALAHLDFRVIGFSSRRKQLESVTSYCGAAEFGEFLSQTQILVCILPKTPQTDNLVDRNALKQLPQGAAVINCGRGDSIHDDDLLEFVRSGHIAHAVLDVFRKEPLPDSHPFWDEPNITISPHCASKPNVETASQVILRNICAFENGQSVPGIVERSRAY